MRSGWAARIGLFWKGWKARFRLRPGAERTLRQFEKLIGYSFRNPLLLEQALKHRSIIAETVESREAANERLEFLGDAVLDLVVSEQLFRQYPQAAEGFLARMKSLAVSGRQLANRGRKIGLGSYMQIAAGEARNGGRHRRSILEDGLEAVIGAIYVDSGLESARKFIRRFVANDLNERLILEKEENYKSALLEYTQGKALGAPWYRVAQEEGPDHAKTFHVQAMVGDAIVGVGIGRSKKQAEQRAACEAADHFGLNK